MTLRTTQGVLYMTLISTQGVLLHDSKETHKVETHMVCYYMTLITTQGALPRDSNDHTRCFKT